MTAAADAERLQKLERRMDRTEFRLDRLDDPENGAVAKVTKIAERTSGRINVLIVAVLVAALAFAGNALFLALNLGVHKP
jgi:hypothetical protein